MLQHHSAMTARALEVGSHKPEPVGPSTRDLAVDCEQMDGTPDSIPALDGVSSSPSNRTLECSPGELIALCRSATDMPPAVDPAPSAVDRATQEYPMLSFPTQLLASAAEETQRVPAVRPPSRSRVRLGRARGLLGCLILVVLPAAFFTILRVLYPSPRAAAATLKTELHCAAAASLCSPAQPPVVPSSAPGNAQPSNEFSCSPQAEPHHHRSRHHSRSLICPVGNEPSSAHPFPASLRTRQRVTKDLVARLGLKPMD